MIGYEEIGNLQPPTRFIGCIITLITDNFIILARTHYSQKPMPMYCKYRYITTLKAQIFTLIK